MDRQKKTIIITGGSQGIGAGLVNTFLERGYNVVATSRRITACCPTGASQGLAMVDGDISDPKTAKQVVQTALERFGAINALVNNAGIFFGKSFLEYTLEDLRKLSSTNIEGFLHLTQLALRQMLAQQSGGSIVSIGASTADHPMAGVNASVAMITKGGIHAVSRSLAMEYARDGIRVNVVAPGIVDTPMHHGGPMDFLKKLSPMGAVSNIQEIVDAVVFLIEAPHITGEVLHVDGGAHAGQW